MSLTPICPDRRKYQEVSLEYINDFQEKQKKGCEAYQIEFEDSEMLVKIYESLRNMVESKHLPIRVIRDVESMCIWLCRWTEEDEKAARAEIEHFGAHLC